MPTVPDPTTRQPPLRLSADFYRLWRATAVSQLGSAVGTGALPLIAILVVHASALQVTAMAAASGLAAAVVALPLGPFVESPRRRPVMIAADIVAFTALAPLTRMERPVGSFRGGRCGG